MNIAAMNEERKSRDQLFSQRRRKSSSTTASEAQSIQRSLQRTQELMKNELHRVSAVHHSIDNDGDVLQRTMDHHKSLNAKGAQKALTSLQRAQQQEQRIFMASVIFFFLTVFYIMWSRVLLKFDFIFHAIDKIVRGVLGIFGAITGGTSNHHRNGFNDQDTSKFEL